MTEPGDANPLTDNESGNVGTEFYDPSHHLVSEGDR
jgi:hypothetical protein